jgi:hypothetical protein
MGSEIKALLIPGRFDHNGPSILAELNDPRPKLILDAS